MSLVINQLIKDYIGDKKRINKLKCNIKQKLKTLEGTLIKLSYSRDSLINAIIRDAAEAINYWHVQVKKNRKDTNKEMDEMIEILDDDDNLDYTNMMIKRLNTDDKTEFTKFLKTDFKYF